MCLSVSVYSHFNCELMLHPLVLISISKLWLLFCPLHLQTVPGSQFGATCASPDFELRVESIPLLPADFFDDKHFVLRGASDVTHQAVARDSFRNFYQRAYPYVFAKFRLTFDTT